MITTVRAQAAYILSRAVIDGDCLIFRQKDSYSDLNCEGKVVRVHRIIACSYGMIESPYTGAARTGPKGQVCVLHTCDNKGCVNPDHLEVGDYKKNNLDAYARGRNQGNPAGGPMGPALAARWRR